MPAPNKAVQDAEAEARQKTGPNNEQVPEVTPEITAQAPDPNLGDNFTQRTPIEPEATDRVRPIVRSPKDEQRAAIVARFRQDRQTEADEEGDSDAQQIRRFAREGMPPELVALHEPEPPAPEVEPAPVEPEAPVTEPEPQAPVKRTIKVRGKTIEISEEELIAAAQKHYAADNYLDEAKAKLKAVDDLLHASQQRAQRPAQPAEHHGGPQAAQTEGTEPAPVQADEGEHNADPFAAMIEKIQYGDPKEAAAVLQNLVATEAGKQSKEALRFERTRNDEIRSQKVLKDFMAAHPDLANDEFASAAIEKRLFNLQKADLEALGIDEDKLPTTPAEIAKWHQYYRVEGHNVRNAETLLTTARDDFLKWRAPASTTVAQPTPAVTAQGANKVAITVNRDARRAAIPQQPTRTGTPRPDAVTNPPPTKERSDIVQQMKLSRAKPRGQVLS